jgi:hypothetical protein
MPLRQFLLSVVAGPSRDVIRASAKSGQKLHFVCQDENKDLDEFDLCIVSDIKEDDVSQTLVFAAIDSTGLTWSLSYSPELCEGNMVRTFGKSG